MHNRGLLQGARQVQAHECVPVAMQCLMVGGRVGATEQGWPVFYAKVVCYPYPFSRSCVVRIPLPRSCVIRIRSPDYQEHVARMAGSLDGQLRQQALWRQIELGRSAR